MKKLWLIGILIVSLFFLACSGQFETTVSLAEDEEISGSFGSYNYYLHVTQIDKKNSFCYLDAYLSSSANPSTEQIVLDKETPVKISGFTASLIGIRESFTGDKCLIKVSNKQEKSQKITGAAARAPPPKPRTATTLAVTTPRTTSATPAQPVAAPRATPAQPATSSRATPATPSSRASSTTATTPSRTTTPSSTTTSVPRAPAVPPEPVPLTVVPSTIPEAPVAEAPRATPATPAAGALVQCRDKADNDGDGLVDYPADKGCISANDNDEVDATPAQPAAKAPRATPAVPAAGARAETSAVPALVPLITAPRATPATPAAPATPRATPVAATPAPRAGTPATTPTPAVPATPASPAAPAQPAVENRTTTPALQPTTGARAGTPAPPSQPVVDNRATTPVTPAQPTTGARAGALTPTTPPQPTTTAAPATPAAPRADTPTTPIPQPITAPRAGATTTVPTQPTASRTGTPIISPVPVPSITRVVTPSTPSQPVASTADRAGTAVTPAPPTAGARTGVSTVLPATSTRTGAPPTTSQPAIDRATIIPTPLTTAGRTGTAATLPQPGTATRAGAPTQPVLTVPRTAIANATSPASRTTSAQTALAVSECADKIDNDQDALIDWPNDPDCTDRKGASEGVKQELLPPAISQCSDGIDNDGDGLIDYDQELVGCETPEDDDETDSGAGSVVEGTGEETAPSALQCADGIDNDGDGLVDYAGGDPGCSGEADSSEVDYVPEEPSGGGGTSAPSTPVPLETPLVPEAPPEELLPEEQPTEEKKLEAQQTVAESTVVGRAEKTIERLTKGETIVIDTSQVIAEVKSVEMTARKEVYGAAFRIEKTEKSTIPPPVAKKVISTFHIEGPESDKMIEVKVEKDKYTEKTTANCFDTNRNKWRPGKVKEKKSDEKYVYLKVALPCRN